MTSARMTSARPPCSTSPTTARSARSASNASKAARSSRAAASRVANETEGRGGILQSPCSRSWASFIASRFQSTAMPRSAGGPPAASWYTDSTASAACSSKPTGRGRISRMPARKIAPWRSSKERPPRRSGSTSPKTSARGVAAISRAMR